MNAFSGHKRWLGCILAAALVFVLWGTALAVEQDDENEVPPPTAELTLDRKTTEVVISTDGDRFKVDEKATVIVGLERQQVDYQNLLVPCDVVVTYHLEKGAKTADLIRITRISATAKKDFFQERPE
jgi:serine protease inhibitor ecotin